MATDEQPHHTTVTHTLFHTLTQRLQHACTHPLHTHPLLEVPVLHTSGQPSTATWTSIALCHVAAQTLPAPIPRCSTTSRFSLACFSRACCNKEELQDTPMDVASWMEHCVGECEDVPDAMQGNAAAVSARLLETLCARVGLTQGSTWAFTI